MRLRRIAMLGLALFGAMGSGASGQGMRFQDLQINADQAPIFAPIEGANSTTIRDLGLSGNAFDAEVQVFLNDPALSFDGRFVDYETTTLREVLARADDQYQLYQLPDGRSLFVLPDSTILMTSETDPTAPFWDRPPDTVVPAPLEGEPPLPLTLDVTVVGFYSDMSTGAIELKLGAGATEQKLSLLPKQLKTIPIADLAAPVATVETTLPDQPDAEPMRDVITVSPGRIYRVFYDLAATRYRISEAHL